VVVVGWAVLVKWLEAFRVTAALRLTEGMKALAMGDLTTTFPMTTTPISDVLSGEFGQMLGLVERARATFLGDVPGVQRDDRAAARDGRRCQPNSERCRCRLGAR